MFGDSNGQIKLRAKQKYKVLSATGYSIARNVFLDNLRTVVSSKSGVEIYYSSLVVNKSKFSVVMSSGVFLLFDSACRLTSSRLWDMFAGYFGPTIYAGSLLKSKRRKRRGQKNIQKKTIQTKINSYNNKYINETLQNVTYILI